MAKYILTLLFLYLRYGVQGLSFFGKAPSSSEKNVSSAFLDSKISPQYIPVPPGKYLNVVYGKGDVVNLGNGLTPLQCVSAPSVSWCADPHLYYTFLMIDLDAVYPDLLPTPGTFLHWGRYNVQGGIMSTGEDFAPYLPVLTPPLSDVHRYVQLVYQQPGALHLDLVDILNTTLDRATFDNQRFVTKYNLGNAMFGNYFLGKFLYT